MTDSITPPPELVQQWYNDARDASVSTPLLQQRSRTIAFVLATRAAQWGADQELGACMEWLDEADLHLDGRYLRAARRPKPPSLKEQALLQLDTLNADLAMHGRGCDLSQIRRALEALPE